MDLPATVPAGLLSNAVVTIDSDFFSPGPLDATWDVPSEPGWVLSRIPINHHVGGPTFTDCEVPAGDGAFSATEAMIDPLAVITGLEFQGIQHVQAIAIDLDEGCVDVRYGVNQYVSPTY